MNPGGRGKVNAAEKAMAHRFAQSARGTIESNKNDMRTPRLALSDPKPNPLQARGKVTKMNQQINLANQEQYRFISPLADAGLPAKISEMTTQDPSIDQDSQLEGFADIGTANVEDQYFDNVDWYRNVYSKIGGTGPHGKDLGEVVLDDRYFKYLEKKKEQEWYKGYEWFKLSLVDLSDPPVRDYWQKKFPELVDKKMKFYKNREAINARLNEIKIRGPQGKEDLEFVYLYNLGMFDTSEISDVNSYLSNPQDRKIWNAAMNKGVINWDKVEWNTKLKEPPSTPLDDISSRIFGNARNITKWQNLPKL